jgi:hypothetical protein
MMKGLCQYEPDNGAELRGFAPIGMLARPGAICC